MDNKFNRKDISTFDPTNASVENVRKWLFAIIDVELEKAPEERDYDLIAECSEFEAELPGSDVELSESEYAAGLERIKARTPATEHKETKILEPKKKTKKSVRIIAIWAASLAVLILSVTVAAAVQGNPVIKFIADNIKAIFSMDTGDKLEEEGVTMIKGSEFQNYPTAEDAIKSLNMDLLYPSYLPERVKIEKIAITDIDDSESKLVYYVANNSEFSIELYVDENVSLPNWENAIIYENDNTDFYIIKTVDGNYQAVGLYNNVRYSIVYIDYDELIKILNGFKEIGK